MLSLRVQSWPQCVQQVGYFNLVYFCLWNEWIKLFFWSLILLDFGTINMLFTGNFHCMGKWIRNSGVLAEIINTSMMPSNVGIHFSSV